MLQRSVFGVVALAMLGALTGCITPPAPTPPRVDSVEVSPQPAQPGDTVTVRVEASHSALVFNGVPVGLVNPQGADVGVEHCSSAIEHVGEDRTHATVTIACVLPALVSNGTWTLSYRLNYSPPAPNFQPPLPEPFTVTFDVVGGSDDVSPPTLVSYHTSPAVLTQRTPFTLTVRVHDDSPVFLGSWNLPNSQNITFSGSDFSHTCRNGTATQVSATEADVVFSCTGGWIGPVGPLTGQVSGDLVVRDALHNSARFTLTLDFEPNT